MDSELILDRTFTAPAGECIALTPLVRRIVANNPGPVTFTGTCSYVVGRGAVAIIDPGPEDEAHVEALLRAVAGEKVTHILVTHTHKDHSPGAVALARATGARVGGCAPHRTSRRLHVGEINPLEASSDRSYAPDAVLNDGDGVSGPGWTLEAVETPGHAANHVAYALREESALFSGDHVMAWSTTLVGPPDGSMSDYMASLEKVRRRPETIYWPGHGGPVTDPQRFVRAIIQHRRLRESLIVRRLAAGDRTVQAIVLAVYAGLAPGLLPAAALTVLAHLEDLVGRGVASVDGPLSLEGEYRLVRT